MSCTLNERESKLETATRRLPGEDLRGLLPDMVTETKKEEAFSTLKEGESIARFGAQFVLRRGLLYETRPSKKPRIYVPRSMVDRVVKVTPQSRTNAQTTNVAGGAFRLA